MKKDFCVSFVLMVIAVLLFSHLILVQAAKPGTFDGAGFMKPDYYSGETETLYVGESRTFNYNCHCADLPGKSSCSGYIRLQVDVDDTGFVDEKSDACNIDEMQTCFGSYTMVFDTPGTYEFRVFCDEDSGTDFAQPPIGHVTLTVQESCTESETRLCELQEGVCEGAEQTCMGGYWSECDYGPDYETGEATCDDLDNDCDGFADEVDDDGDGYGACGGMGIVNELLINGLNNDGNIAIFAYNPFTSSYNTIWSTDTPGISGSASGGEIGDLTHDGMNDFVITRYAGSGDTLEVWTYDPSSQEWYEVWSKNDFVRRAWVGGIGDFDNDGFTELLVTADGDSIQVWGNDTYNATGFAVEKTLETFGGTGNYPEGAGDLNDNGIPEIVLHAEFSTNFIKIYEWNGTDYELKQTVESQFGVMDDIECGDLDRDGIDECVLCGNSGKSHVLEYSGGSYAFVYNSTATYGSFPTETCSIADVTNDGWLDWFDVSHDSIRVFSYNGSAYVNVWNTTNDDAYVACSFAGDSDNDGKGEFLTCTQNQIMLWESGSTGATSFVNTFTWIPVIPNANIIIGNLNPYNDEGGVDCNDSDDSINPDAPDVCGDGIDQDCDGEDAVCNCVDVDSDDYYGYDPAYCPTGSDCDDNNYFINPGMEEVCDDGVDNNCNNQIDEGCNVCGDGYCAGMGSGEDCITCPGDCSCIGRACSKACCGDGVCNPPFENAGKCPVDCN